MAAFFEFAEEGVEAALGGWVLPGWCARYLVGGACAGIKLSVFRVDIWLPHLAHTGLLLIKAPHGLVHEGVVRPSGRE